MEDGVYMNPITGDVVATGNIHANGINISHMSNIRIDNSSFEDVVRQIVFDVFDDGETQEF